MEEKILKEKEMDVFAKNILNYSVKKDGAGSAVLALCGELGSGKTTFAKSFAAALGIQEVVVSPTFILERVYDLPESASAFKRFIHIDAYRLENEKELRKLGWGELISNPENIILVEWADRVVKAIPPWAIWMELHYVDEKTRRLLTY